MAVDLLFERRPARVSSPWRIELFGGIRALRAGRAVPPFRTQRAAWLLARLALQPARHGRDELVETFWPAVAPAAGRQSLSQALSEIRRRLGDGVLVATVESVHLAREACAVDAWEFDRAIARAHLARGQTRRAWLERAVELASAPLLPGLDHAWATLARSAVAAECDAALRELVEHHAHRGDLPLAFDYAFRRLRFDPLGEDAHRELARLYRRVGRTAAALEHLQRVERTVQEALGQAADAETRALASALREAVRRLRVDWTGSPVR